MLLYHILSQVEKGGRDCCQRSMIVSPLWFLPVSPENDRPSSLVLEVIDYNMPLTTTYMKHMKLQCMGNNKVRAAAAT